MKREEWISLYIINVMSSYDAVKYDHNCYVGWREKTQYMGYEDALHLALAAYDRMMEIKGN